MPSTHGRGLTIDLGSPLHAWGIVGDAVISVEGNLLAYDAASLTRASFCPAIGDQPSFSDVSSGLPSSGIESRPFFMGAGAVAPSVGWYARAMAITQGIPLVGAFEVAATDDMNNVADLGSGFPLSVDTKGDGTEEGGFGQHWEMVTFGIVDPNFDPGALVAEITAKGAAAPPPVLPDGYIHIEPEWTRIEPDEAAKLVDYNPPPVLDLDGFELVDVLHAPESVLAHHNRTEQVLVYTYRGPGMEHITVTTRLMPALNPGEGADVPLTTEDWVDPLVSGPEGSTESDTDFVVAITPAGHELTIDLGSPLHAWGIVGDAVITVEGNVLPDTLAPAVDQILGS